MCITQIREEKTMLQYKVSVSYHHFVFDNKEEAFQFAELAKTHFWDKEDKEVNVEIELEFAELPFATVDEVREGEEE